MADLTTSLKGFSVNESSVGVVGLIKEDFGLIDTMINGYCRLIAYLRGRERLGGTAAGLIGANQRKETNNCAEFYCQASLLRRQYDSADKQTD